MVIDELDIGLVPIVRDESASGASSRESVEKSGKAVRSKTVTCATDAADLTNFCGDRLFHIGILCVLAREFKRLSEFG